MRTSELIDLLGADTGGIARGVPQRRLGLSALVGAGAALLLVLVWLGLRPDLARAAAGGFFWVKAAYTAALGGAGFWAAERLSRPGTSARTAARVAGVVFGLFLVAAFVQLASMNGAAQLDAVRGVSWRVCSRNIVILAAPMLLISLLVMRSLAPTKPMLAGFAAGGFAGGVAATIYGLHCPEATFVFVGLWYTLGVAVSGLIGAVLGRWMLRW